MLNIDYEKCCWKDGKCTSCTCDGACEGCVEACPEGAITRDDLVRIDQSKCTECGVCVSACEKGALSLE